MKNLKSIELFGQILNAHNFADSTIMQYKACLRHLSIYYNLDFSKVYQKDIQAFLVHRVVELSKSFSDENQHINAIKQYWNIILNIEINPKYIKRPKKDDFLPNVLSPQQVDILIFNTANLKHRAILYTIYHNGLRISEALNLKISDVITKCDDPHLIIRETKQHHTRVVYMGERCVQVLRQYYKQCKPSTYLFEGSKDGAVYSKTSVHNVLKAALKREGITRCFRVHDLRHCFATHCLAAGTDIYHLSKILGHKSVKTTERIYLHLRPKDLHIVRPDDIQHNQIKRTA